MLPTLLSPERMLHLAKQADKLSLLYSFCHSGAQQSYYFVANQDELIKHQAYAAFINEIIRANTLTC